MQRAGVLATEGATEVLEFRTLAKPCVCVWRATAGGRSQEELRDEVYAHILKQVALNEITRLPQMCALRSAPFMTV